MCSIFRCLSLTLSDLCFCLTSPFLFLLFILFERQRYGGKIRQGEFFASSAGLEVEQLGSEPSAYCATALTLFFFLSFFFNDLFFIYLKGRITNRAGETLRERERKGQRIFYTPAHSSNGLQQPSMGQAEASSRSATWVWWPKCLGQPLLLPGPLSRKQKRK